VPDPGKRISRFSKIVKARAAMTDETNRIDEKREASGSASEAAAPTSAEPAVIGADFAKKAKDLEALRSAVIDAASVGAGLWLSYLFVLFYLAIAVGSVTHRNLLFESPVKLPFLNVDLPLIGFFVLGPAIFLIVHAYVLLHFVLPLQATLRRGLPSTKSSGRRRAPGQARRTCGHHRPSKRSTPARTRPANSYRQNSQDQIVKVLEKQVEHHEVNTASRPGRRVNVQLRAP
jgi:hypothetical protein